MKRLVALVLVATAPALPTWAADRTKPKVSFATADGAVILSNPQKGRTDMLPIEVTGTAKDSSSGVRKVVVSIVPCTTHTETSCSFSGVYTTLHEGGPVTTTCTSSSRRSCSWRAPAPTMPGWYWVGAYAVDYAGNRSSGKLISILVV